LHALSPLYSGRWDEVINDGKTLEKIRHSAQATNRRGERPSWQICVEQGMSKTGVATKFRRNSWTFKWVARKGKALGEGKGKKETRTPFGSFCKGSEWTGERLKLGKREGP